MEKIPRMFEYLERKIIYLWETDEELKKKKTQLALVKKSVSYMRANWIVSKVWPPAKWCVLTSQSALSTTQRVGIIASIATIRIK